MKFIVDENGKRSAIVVDLHTPRSKKAWRTMLQRLQEDLEDLFDYKRTLSEPSQPYETFRKTLLKRNAKVRRRG